LKIFATIVGLAAALCLSGALRLFYATLRFYLSDLYAPHSSAMPLYTAGGIEAGGTGIFMPAALLLGLGLFLAKFALNLWRNKC
jgi:hypothetical protein